MVFATPLMPFLRPLRLPKPSTVRSFLRYSTSAPCRQASASRAREDPNLVASRRAPESYPPPSMKSKPRPNEARASRRTATQPTKQRHYPTRRPSHHQPEMPKLIPDPVEQLPEEQSAPNLPYFISRSNYNSLPIYTLRKRGGNLKLTKIKNVDGDRLQFKLELVKALDIKKDMAAVNSITGHVIIKGHVKPQVEKFLRARRF